MSCDVKRVLVGYKAVSVQFRPYLLRYASVYVIQETFSWLIITSLSTCLCELTAAVEILRADLFVLERVRSCSGL